MKLRKRSGYKSWPSISCNCAVFSRLGRANARDVAGMCPALLSYCWKFVCTRRRLELELEPEPETWSSQGSAKWEKILRVKSHKLVMKYQHAWILFLARPLSTFAPFVAEFWAFKFHFSCTLTWDLKPYIFNSNSLNVEVLKEINKKYSLNVIFFWLRLVQF